MKKLNKITAALASLALVAAAFTGCVNAHADLEPATFPEGIIGTPTCFNHSETAKDIGWGDAWVEAFTYENGVGTYTFKYVESKWEEGAGNAAFKLYDLSTSTEYGAAALTGLDTDGFTWDMSGGNAVVSGLTAGSSYTITVVGAASPILSIAVAEGDSGSSLPIPYYFDGVMYLVGDVYALAGGTNAWSFSTENLISGGSVDASTGIVTYTKDITAVAASGQLGINDSSWGNKQNGAGVTVNADGTEVLLDGTEGNFAVTGLTAGKPYRVTITTNPDKEVSVSIVEICNYTLTFKVVGGDEGTEYYFDGNVFGNWHNSWPIKSWTNGKATAYTDAKSAHPECFATADDTGVAVFTASVNYVGEPGETASYVMKVVSCTSDGADPVYESADTDFDITVSGKTFLVTFDVSEGEITVE